jgi:hypothetical protein
MKLMFEIRDLKFATPATATRAGILFISENKQWHSMVGQGDTNRAPYKDMIIIIKIISN